MLINSLCSHVYLVAFKQLHGYCVVVFDYVPIDINTHLFSVKILSLRFEPIQVKAILHKNDETLFKEV